MRRISDKKSRILQKTCGQVKRKLDVCICGKCAEFLQKRLNFSPHFPQSFSVFGNLPQVCWNFRLFTRNATFSLFLHFFRKNVLIFSEILRISLQHSTFSAFFHTFPQSSNFFSNSPHRFCKILLFFGCSPHFSAKMYFFRIFFLHFFAHFYFSVNCSHLFITFDIANFDVANLFALVSSQFFFQQLCVSNALAVALSAAVHKISHFAVWDFYGYIVSPSSSSAQLLWRFSQMCTTEKAETRSLVMSMDVIFILYAHPKEHQAGDFEGLRRSITVINFCPVFSVHSWNNPKWKDVGIVAEFRGPGTQYCAEKI